MSQICHKYGWYIVTGLLAGLEAYLIYMSTVTDNSALNAFNAATVNVASGETLSCSSIYTVNGDLCILSPNITQIFTACMNLCDDYTAHIDASLSYITGASLLPFVVVCTLGAGIRYHGNPCRKQSENEQGFYAQSPNQSVNYGTEGDQPSATLAVIA